MKIILLNLFAYDLPSKQILMSTKRENFSKSNQCSQ